MDVIIYRKRSFWEVIMGKIVGCVVFLICESGMELVTIVFNFIFV